MERNELRRRLREALKPEIKDLNPIEQKILVDDMVTAFYNRKKVFNNE